MPLEPLIGNLEKRMLPENLHLSPAQFSQLREQRFKDAKILIEFRERISTQASSDINKNLYIVTGNKRFTRPWYSINSDDGLISKISSRSWKI